MEQPYFEVNQKINSSSITPEQVRGLSLGKVTEQYATLGLYTRIVDTMKREGFGENELVQLSLRLGLTLHFNDVRTNGRYIDHLMRVTLHMLEDFNIKDPNLIAAGPLHDTLEDHPFDLASALTGERLSEVAEARTIGYQALAYFTNPEVADIVASVTNPEVTPGEDKQAVYTENTTDIVLNQPKGRVLKLADFIDNACGNHATIGGLQHKLDLKYIDQYKTHMVGLFLQDSLITGEERQKALNILSVGHARALGRLASSNISINLPY
jgi:hypothetical protein